MIRAIIVDDEAPARREITRFLEAAKDFEIVGEASDGTDAVNVIRGTNADVVFLDIHMPGLSGVEVAHLITKSANAPLIVFVTAYDEFALQAFELSAIDYLLKPIEEDRFAEACDRIRSKLDNKDERQIVSENTANYLENKKPLKIVGHERNSKERVFLHFEDVLFFEANLAEVTARLQDGRVLIVASTLKGLSDILDPERFQQAHRAFIVNLDAVEKAAPMFSGNYELTMKDDAKTKIPMSRRYAKTLKQKLKW